MSEDDDIVTNLVNHAKSIKGNFVNGEFVNNFTKTEIGFLIKDIDDFNREHAKMSEIKAHTKTYVVVDEKNIERIYSNIASVKIWRKKLILRSKHGNIIASFSSWKSSSVWHKEQEPDL